MTIHDLYQFCDSKYVSEGRCTDCENEKCQGDCCKCLEDIHARRQNRRYDCDNITYCYVCKHLYRYASEIEYLLQAARSIVKSKEWNIVSIGCGPSSELFGFLGFRERQGLGANIHYNGLDLNNAWKPIHKQISKMASSEAFLDVTYNYVDAFDYLMAYKPKSESTRYNFLVMQYLISDMQQHNMDIRSFLEKVVDHIICRMPIGSIIILNDINHNQLARDYFGVLCRLARKSNTVKCYTYHFDDGNIVHSSQRYGNEHPRQTILYTVPRSKHSYDPWCTCRSAQMLIHKIG